MQLMNKEKLAQLVREKRTGKGITQQELADMAGISLRSVQRIENGEVLPRSYTLRVIAEKLDFDATGTKEAEEVASTAIATTSEKSRPPREGLNRPRKLILTIGLGLVLLLGTAAYISQSAGFPQTDFEGFLLWGGVTCVYVLILYRLWR